MKRKFYGNPVGNSILQLQSIILQYENAVFPVLILVLLSHHVDGIIPNTNQQILSAQKACVIYTWIVRHNNIKYN